MTTTTTNNNDDHAQDHGKDTRIASPCKLSHNNIYSIMGGMDPQPSSLERSFSIIDISLSLALDDEDAYDIYSTEVETETQKENENKTIKETPKKTPSSSSSSLKRTILTTPSSSLLPRSARRMPLLPRRGLFQQQDKQRQQSQHNHERARILKNYDSSLLAFPILPSSSSRSRSTSAMLPASSPASDRIVTNSNGNNIFSPIPSCIGLLSRRRTRQRQLDNEYHQSAAGEQESQEQECCHPKKKGRRYIDTCVAATTMSQQEK